MKIIYDISTRTFASFGDTAKSVGSSISNKASTFGKNWLSNNATSKYNRSNAAFKIGKSLDYLNQNKELKAQILGGRGKRIWYNPKTWIKGEKINGMINDAGQVATAVTGNQKYQQAAQGVSNIGKTATQMGSQQFQKSTGMTHTSDGNLLIKDRKKAIEYGQKMDSKKKSGLGSKGGTWQENLVKNEVSKNINSNDIAITDAAQKKLGQVGTWKGRTIANTFDTTNQQKRSWYRPKTWVRSGRLNGYTINQDEFKANQGKQLDVVNGKFITKDLPVEE